MRARDTRTFASDARASDLRLIPPCPPAPRELGVPLVSLVENMAYFTDPSFFASHEAIHSDQVSAIQNQRFRREPKP